MKLFRRILLAIAVLFVLSQLYRPAHENPAVDQNMVIEKSMNVPPNVQAILSRSCADCHSSKTVWPWYTNVAPVSWLVIDDVHEGRQEMNLSEWGTFSERRKRRKLQEICEQVSKKEMPLSNYVMIHHDAALSDADRKALCDWANAEREKIPASASAVPPRKGS